MKKFDEIFRKKLADQEASYPSNLWSKIEADLDRTQKKNRFLPIYFFSGISLIAAMILSALWINAENGQISPTNESLTIHEHSIEKLQTLEQKASLDDKTEKSEYKAIVIDEANEEISASSIELGLFKPDEAIASNELTIHVEPTASLNSESAQNNRTLGVEMISELDEADINLNQTSLLESHSLESIQNEFITISNNLIGTESNSLDLNNSRILPDLNTIETTNLSNYEYTPSLSKALGNPNTVDCEGVDEVKSGFSIDVYFSPDYAIRDLNASSSEFSSYLLERERTENPGLSFSAGGRVSYTNASGFSIRSGLNFTQINETFNYSETFIEQIDTMITITISTGTDGQTTTQIDTIVSQQLGTRDLTTRNSFKSIDLPVLIGLEMPINDRFSLSINTGFYVNALFQSRGRILSSEFEPVWITDDTGDLEVFKTGLGISYFGSIGLHHELSPGLELLIEPNLRYYSQSFTIGSYPLTQDYIKFGMMTGLRFKF